MNRIKQLRKERSVKQSTLADAISVSPAALSGYETGKHEPDIETYKKIADYFTVTLDYLLCAEQTEKTAAVASDVTSGLDRELIRMLCQFSPDDCRRVKDFAKGIESARGE